MEVVLLTASYHLISHIYCQDYFNVVQNNKTQNILFCKVNLNIPFALVCIYDALIFTVRHNLIFNLVISLTQLRGAPLNYGGWTGQTPEIYVIRYANPQAKKVTLT